MSRIRAGLVVVALLATAPVAADVPPPNPDYRGIRYGEWDVSCTIDPQRQVLTRCAARANAGLTSIDIQYYNDGALHYSITRSCLPIRAGESGHRQGLVAVEPVPQSALWGDFVILYQLPVAPACTGTPASTGGNFQQDTETVIALLRAMPPLPAGASR